MSVVGESRTRGSARDRSSLEQGLETSQHPVPKPVGAEGEARALEHEMTQPLRRDLSPGEELADIEIGITRDPIEHLAHANVHTLG